MMSVGVSAITDSVRDSHSDHRWSIVVLLPTRSVKSLLHSARFRGRMRSRRALDLHKKIKSTLERR